MEDKKTPKESLEAILAISPDLTERVEISEDFQKELKHLLNSNGIDSRLNISDFKLAKYIVKMLKLIPTIR